jgi:hypothetical protein
VQAKFFSTPPARFSPITITFPTFVYFPPLIRQSLLRSIAVVVPFWAFASPAVAKVSATPTVSPTGRSIDDEAFRAAHRASQSVSHWLGTPRSAEVLGRIFHGGEALSSNHLADIFEREAGACRLELRSHHELSGAFGAFTPRGANGRPTLYLNADWLHCGASDAAVQRVLVEEMGHLIDHLLHPGIDSPGDEGQLFAAAVLGQEPGSQELVEIQQEDDSLVLTIDGSRLLVECAANIVDAKFSAFDFSVGSGDQRIAGSANTPGESWLYLDVLTIDGKTVDAIVTFDSISSGSSMTTFDSNSNPYGSAITWGSSANFLQPNFTWGAGGGSADFSIRFIESGSYNASSNPSGSPLILRNVLANSYDVDSTTTSSSAQYTIFSNIGGLELHGSTQLAVTGDSAQTQISAIGFPGNIQADPGTETGDKYRVRVSYDELPVLSFTVGANGSGIAYYSIDVGPGPGFTSVQNFDLLLGGGEVVTSESGTSDTFTLVLGAQPSSDVTISLTDLDTSEGALSTTSLTFTPANWATPQQITVTGVADALVDGDVKYTLKAQASSTDLRFDGRMVLVDVTNLDVLPPVDGPLTVSNVVVNEASPFAVFTVSGEAGQKAMLSLSNGTAGSADYGPGLETFDGTKWVPYTTGALVSLDANGKLLVRTPIQQDTAFENSETFTLTATNTSGSPGSGTGTIKDDGTGDIFLADNKAATPSLPTDPGYPTLDDDRALTVSSVTVNEASPFAVFTVSGQPGQKAMLSLSNGTAGSADYGPGLETFDGTKWVPYTTGALVSLDANGKLLVRTPIQQDTAFENSETFTLTATNTSGSPGSGTGTIKDDGTGDIFLADNKAATPSLPTDPGYPTLDDDRALTVSSVTVNEASPFAVFTVSGQPGQKAMLSLSNGTAGSADYGPGLETFDGTKWVTYTTGALVSLDANGKLLVRTPIQQDSLQETSEIFSLVATNTSGTPATGNADIRDDGTGDIFGPDGAPDPIAPKDDDRPLAVSSPVVNEGSPYAVFAVSGASGQLASFALADGTAGSADYGPTLEFFDGSRWVAYVNGTQVTLDKNGTLLLRTPVTNDGVTEISEKFDLIATNTGGTAAVGTAEIRDDGKGTVFGPLGQPDPAAINDDDRPLTVSNVTAHESLGYAVFTVGGAQDQLVSLDTRDGTATEGSGDFGPGLEYFDGANWIAYTGGYVSLSSAGQIQVRISLKDDGVAEGLENFQLAARNTGYDGTLGEYRGTARVPERIVELYVMENETFISPYASHFSGYSGYHIVGGPDDVMFVSDAASTNLEFKLPATYFLGGDNQHRVVVEANDPGADPDQALFIVNVMSFKAISLTPLGSLRLDRQSGLYKQQLRVANLHVHPIGGLRFTVSLIPGATLFNANTTTVGGEGAIRYDGVLAGINEVGSSFDVTVEVLYKSLSSTNGGAGATLPDPLYRPDLIVMEPSGPPPAPDSTAPTVSYVRLFNGDSMIEWETVVGETYAVEYSSDLRTWIRVNPLIVANSHRTQWIDNGLPKTMSHPSAAGSRFYRVVLLK